ncbi:AprI/Inh family metalloprotease inhibitor [Methylobacterium sp. NEAU 140]|uniref:AprI/Inh family metalloprotease inhibitor n=1 Tax=Methylobacterium sp. NEAU 140 TaxID=3064945 RepID=UPI002732FEC0|nr:AprI/Inh family metalloprotease inhibitor [Methylobacterium sp. NEAU 140]MDP4024659.1 AprI/Inh family metalloprotease inhibitor [Methylobacterium sp. NEAU 140]
MRGLLAALLLALGPEAVAAPVPSFIADSAGTWLVATDDGRPGCRVALAAERAGKAWRATPDAACAARLPAVARAVAWEYQGGVRLLGPDGKVLLAFGEDETTLLKTAFETPPVHFMVRARAGVERAPHAPALVGAWALRRPGGPVLCPLTLTRGAKEGETELSLKTGTPCDPAVARLRLDTARVEDFTLMLYGKPETSLSFEPSGAESYAKTGGGKPLEMVRAP